MQIAKEKLLSNLSRNKLIEASVKKGHGHLGPNGELLIETGKHTGRSANDKYVVDTDITKNSIWWENNLNRMTEADFEKLQTDVLEYLNSHQELYHVERSLGAHSTHHFGVELFTTHPHHALFAQNMFLPKRDKENETNVIYHAPLFEAEIGKYNNKSGTIVATCFKRKVTIIVGTLYAGEIKKSMFSVMNFILPEKNLLPMHSGASQAQNGETFVFFGLSGTGKTTLSTDVDTLLIGDDEHGLSDEGVFNFEGGCYAKTYKLGADTEPDIYKASTRFGALLENVFVKDNGDIDFFDNSVTENGRSSYPLDFIPARVEDSKGKVPKNLFFLSADAFGVLPPVAKLNPDQAMFYFILGYTAKLAGTEIGVKEPKSTFSPCFGAPFMLRHPTVYAKLLSHYMNKHQINVWLINTGWYKGPFGVGERFPLSITRNIIRAIQHGELNSADMVKDPVFDFMIPKKVREFGENVLFPEKNWPNATQYQEERIKLKNSFDAQMKKFQI